eukprot:UN06943
MITTSNVCQCIWGTAAVGSACTSNGAFICASCDTGYYLSGTSCPANVCSCSNGSAAMGVTCPSHGSAYCISCSDGSSPTNGVCSVGFSSAKDGICVTEGGHSPPNYSKNLKNGEDVNTCKEYCVERSYCSGYSYHTGVDRCALWVTALNGGPSGFTNYGASGGWVNGEKATKGSGHDGWDCYIKEEGTPSCGTAEEYSSNSGSCIAVSCQASSACSVNQTCVDRTITCVTSPCAQFSCESCPTGEEYDVLNNGCVAVNCSSSNTGCTAGQTCVNDSNITCVKSPCAQYYCETPGQNTCVCNGGTAATGSACTSSGANICTSCNAGYTQSGSTCMMNVCQCNGGTAASGSSCTSNGASICSGCNTGYYASGNMCVMNVCSCTSGTAASGSACTANGANICSGCNNGYYQSGNFCVMNQCSCTGGTAATGTACPSHGSEYCTSCNATYELSGNTCQATTPGEVSYEHRTEGGVCQTAGDDMAPNYSGNGFTDETCRAACNDLDTCVGYSVYNQQRCALWLDSSSHSGAPAGLQGFPGSGWVVGESKLTKGSGHANWTCYIKETTTSTNVCACTNGVAAQGSACTTDGAQICGSCNNGYYLNGNMCSMKQCTCNGGTGGSGTQCPAHGSQYCVSCSGDLQLTAQYTCSSAEPQTCSANNFGTDSAYISCLEARLAWVEDQCP